MRVDQRLRKSLRLYSCWFQRRRIRLFYGLSKTTGDSLTHLPQCLVRIVSVGDKKLSRSLRPTRRTLANHVPEEWTWWNARAWSAVVLDGSDHGDRRAVRVFRVLEKPDLE